MKPSLISSFPSSRITPLVLGAVACLTATVYGEEGRFEIEFRKVTDNPSALKATASKGAAAPLRAPATLQYEEDLVAHSGVWGLRLQPGSPLVFSAKDNLPASTGIVITEIRTPSLEGEATLFSLAIAGGGQLRLTADGATGSVVVRQITGEGASSQSGQSRLVAKAALPKAEDRVEIAFAYHLGEQRGWLFLNGKEMAAVDLPDGIQWGDEIVLGSADADAGSAVTLSSFRVVQGGQNSAEVAKTLAELVPSLPPAGVVSPWYAEGQPRLALEALEPDTVLSPWEPVQWKAEGKGNAATAEVWGRTYQFSGGEALVSQVTALGKPLLSGAGIQILANGQPIAFEETPQVVAQHKGQVLLKRTAKGRHLEATVRVEYDGMVWIEMEVEPASRNETLALTIPMAPEFARYYHYIGAPHRYESQNLRRNSYSGELPASGPMALPFKTNVWLGNTQAGLSWFTESDEGWWPYDRAESIVFERNADGSGQLKLNLITEALPAAAPAKVTFRFGLMATPVKPMPKGWRGWSLSAQYDSLQGERRGTHLIYWPDEWRSIFLDPEPTRARNPERTRNKVKADREAGRRIIPYWSRIHVPVTDGKVVNPDIDAMRKAFSVEPDRPAGSTNDMIRVSASSAWSDYLVWAYNRWNDHLGAVDGWYLDETQPIPNTREASGGGYDGWDGKRRPTFEFLATRDLMKRVVYLTEQWGRTPQFVIHNSSTYAMPYMSFYQTFLVGEQFNSGYFHPNPEVLPPEHDKTYFYSYVLPMDRLIVEGFWRQWGMPITWMGQLKNQKELMDNRATARDFLSRVLQMDALYWPLFIHNRGIYDFHKAGQAFGIAGDDVTFTPYWENTTIAGSNAEVVCGYYENSRGWLLVCSNLSRSPQETTLDLSQLGALTSLLNAENNQPLEASDGKKLVIKLARNDYTLIQINR